MEFIGTNEFTPDNELIGNDELVCTNKEFVCVDELPSQNILTIDIGLKNLAMCIMSCTSRYDMLTYRIHLWDVFDTIKQEPDVTCKAFLKNGNVCNKKCKFMYTREQNTIYCCKIHFPEDVVKKENIVKKIIIKNYPTQDIIKNVLRKLTCIYNDNLNLFRQLKVICIELQPSINSSMKMVSHVIYGKLIELFSDTDCVIKFVRASRKLKTYTGPAIECKLKGKYAQRKWLSVKYTEWFLNNRFCVHEKEWLDVLLRCNKRDDMGDTFLMAIDALQRTCKHKVI